MMAWAEVILSEKLLLVFRCFTNKMVLFGFAKSKAINFSFKDYFDRSICNSRTRLARQKTIQIRSSSRLCSMRALGSTQRNRFMQTSLSKVCSTYCVIVLSDKKMKHLIVYQIKYKKVIVLSFLTFNILPQ